MKKKINKICRYSNEEQVVFQCRVTGPGGDGGGGEVFPMSALVLSRNSGFFPQFKSTLGRIKELFELKGLKLYIKKMYMQL